MLEDGVDINRSHQDYHKKENVGNRQEGLDGAEQKVRQEVQEEVIVPSGEWR